MKDPIRKALAWQRRLDEAERLMEARKAHPLRAVGSVDGIPMELTLECPHNTFVVQVTAEGRSLTKEYCWFGWESALRLFYKLKRQYGFVENEL